MILYQGGIRKICLKGRKCCFLVVIEFLYYYYFYAPTSKDRGHIVLPLSVCLSVRLHKLNMKTEHFPITPLVTRLIFGMKAHLTNTYLLVPRSSAKVKVKYQVMFLKDGSFRGNSVSQTHLVFFFFFILLK